MSWALMIEVIISMNSNFLIIMVIVSCENLFSYGKLEF